MRHAYWLLLLGNMVVVCSLRSASPFRFSKWSISGAEFMRSLYTYAPVNSSCAHPPPGQLRGICTHRQSRGSGISLPKGYPRAFDTRGFWLEIQTKTILSVKTSSLSLIGLSVKDWTKLWRFLKVCFLDFRHFLIVYQATTLKHDRERSLWLCISRSKRIPGVGHLLSSFIPTPGNLPPKSKKVLMPGG